VAVTEVSAEELAAEAGTTVRTIRFYQSEGLLPPPLRQGREARYGADHRARLQLIADLQARGLRLSAIADLLRHAPVGTAAEWLGLGETLERPWSDDEPTVLGEAALADRLADAGAADATLDGLVRTGVVERRADTSPAVYFVPSPAMLDLALESIRLGLDLETGARLRDVLQRRLREAATELVARFTDEVSLGHLAAEGPAGLATLLDQLRPLTRRTVDVLFAHEMERAQRGLLDAADAATPKGTP
jgi:DNA-binding transcriptional MerR regulator